MHSAASDESGSGASDDTMDSASDESGSGADDSSSGDEASWPAVAARMKSLSRKMSDVWDADSVDYKSLRAVYAAMKVAMAKVRISMEKARVEEMNDLRAKARRSEQSARNSARNEQWARATAQKLRENLDRERRRREEQAKEQSGIQESLKKLVEEEKEKTMCIICQEATRDTLIMPCLHFHFCFKCVSQHISTASNSCPTCRGSIAGTLLIRL